MTHYSQGTGQIDYQHYADGRVSFAGDLTNPYIFDRAYSYDHVGRLSQGLTGGEARGGTTADGPYKQTYSYDVFDNMTSRHNRFWSQPDDPFTASYTNDRNTAWGYDVAGNIKNDTLTHKFDVVSRPTHVTDSIGLFVVDQSYDGDGQPAKRVEQRPSLNYPITTFYVRSSVLGGQVVTELSTTGFRAGTHNTHLYVSGTEIAVYDSWLNQVLTKLSDPVVGRGLDPLGGYVGFTDPFVQNPNTTYDSLHPNEGLYLQDANPFDPGSGCELDGMPTDCSRLTRALENGTVGLYIGAAGKIGRVYDVSNYQAGFGGMWVSEPTPSDPEYGKIPGQMKVTDNAYKDVWVPFGNQQSTTNLPTGRTNLQNVFALQPPVPRPSMSNQIPVWCNPDVIEAMKRAWARSSNGISRNEAGFILNGNPSSYHIIDTKSGNSKDYQQMTVYTGGDSPTFALFHVHPNNSTSYPSTPENNALGNKEGDTGLANRLNIPFYIISSRGLTVYDPKTKQLPGQMLRRNLDWANPCT